MMFLLEKRINFHLPDAQGVDMSLAGQPETLVEKTERLKDMGYTDISYFSDSTGVYAITTAPGNRRTEPPRERRGR